MAPSEQNNAQTVLRTENIVKDFPGVRALDHVDFSLQPGEIHGLVGENGAGKSTLIRILSGVYPPDNGNIYLNGREISIDDPAHARKLGMAFVYQELDLVTSYTVGQNIMLGREPTGSFGLLRWKELYKTAGEALETLGIPINPRTDVNQLSPSQQQMVAIARLITERVQILVLDEPTSRLEAVEVEELFKLLTKLKDQGISIIYVTQRLHEIIQLCDRATVLRGGKVAGTLASEELDMDRMVRLILGDASRRQVPRSKTNIDRTGEPILKVEDLRHPNWCVGVTLDVYKGEVVGLTGRVGAGKSEAAGMIYGAEEKVSGRISFAGEHVTVEHPAQAAGKGIALLPEERRRQALLLSHSVRKNISLADLSAISWLGFVRESAEIEMAQEMVQQLDIKTPSVETAVKYLSGGNQQKVVIGRWLQKEARLYIFDEPTVGIDIGAKEEVYRLVRLLAEQGAGVLFITSDLDEVFFVCDRVLVMSDGKIVLNKLIEDTDKQELLRASLEETSEVGSLSRIAPGSINEVTVQST